MPNGRTSKDKNGRLDRLVREEIVQPVRGAACGGTHRLMGLSYADPQDENSGANRSSASIKRPKSYIAQYHKYTRSVCRTPTGRSAPAWFVRREARHRPRPPPADDRPRPGMALFLTQRRATPRALGDEDRDLRDQLAPRLEHHEWQIGHLGHALHALQMYNERMYGGPIRSYEGMVSRRPIKTAQGQDTAPASAIN